MYFKVDDSYDSNGTSACFTGYIFNATTNTCQKFVYVPPVVNESNLTNNSSSSDSSFSGNSSLNSSSYNSSAN